MGRRAASWGVVCLVPILALGAVTEWGLVATAVTVAVVLGWLLRTGPMGAGQSWAGRLALAAAVLSAVIGVCQLMPLPASVVAVISPRSFEVWTRAGALLGERLRPRVSVDPWATLFATTTALLGVAGIVAGQRFAGARRGRQAALVLLLVVVTGCVLALGHGIAGLHSVYGVFAIEGRPLETLLVVPSLLNPNHAAALFAVGPPLAVGLAVDREVESDWRVWLALCAVLCSCCVLLTLSRGGVLVLCVELVLLVAIFARRLRRWSGTRLGIGWLVLGLAGLAGAGIWLMARGYLPKDLDKVRIAVQAWQVVRAYPVGTGKGAFEAAFGPYEGGLGGDVRYTHPENILAQSWSDHGLVLGSACLLLLAASVALSARRALRRPWSAGAWVAIVGLAVHDLADFSLQYSGVLLLATTLLGLVTGRVLPKEHEYVRPRLGSALLLPAIILAVSALLVREGGRSGDGEAGAIAATATREGASDAVARLGLDGFRRHPALPYFPMMVGAAWLGRPEGGAFLLRAVQLAPQRAQPHFWLARWFVSVQRRGQGWTEYRVALKLVPRLAPQIVQDMVRQRAPVQEFLAFEPDHNAMTIAATSLELAGRTADADMVDIRLCEVVHGDAGPFVRRLHRLAKDSPERTNLLNLVAKSAPKDPRTWLAIADAEPEGVEAEKKLELGLKEIPSSLELLERLIEVRGKRLGATAVADVVERWQREAGAQGVPRWRIEIVLGKIELGRKSYVGALAHLLQAVEESGGERTAIELAVSAAELGHNHSTALSLLERLRAEYPDEPSYRVDIARIKGLSQ